VKIGAATVPLEPGCALDGFEGGVRARVPGLADATGAIPFELVVTLNGSHGLRFAPVGSSNDVTLSSTWPDPSFQGAFLPTQRDVSAKGFTARWQMSHYGRAYPPRWTALQAVPAKDVTASLFGVDLVSVMDPYRYVERSIKYGVLVLVLAFTAFFLFETLGQSRIHPFQYSLVGVALCLFYLAELALSEIMPFGAAYWIGACAATLMISLYAAGVLGTGRRAFAAAGGLLTVYGFLFVVLRLQDYSLLVGTAGLFAAVALVMYVTRRVDWYARDEA
jgi:inner membrane protein